MSATPDAVWLRTTCSQNGLQLNDNQLALLERYSWKLLEWNKSINLISRRDEENFWRVHLLHSLSVLFKLEIPSMSTVLDLGTGGGLPGIPLKVARPDLVVTLLDSTKKKTNVVSDIVHALELNDVDVVCARAEDVGGQEKYSHRFDVVFARAVASLKDLVRWSWPFLKRGDTKTVLDVEGHPASARRMIVCPSLVAFKGGEIEGEIQQVRNDPRVKALSTINLSIAGSHQLEAGEKKLVVVEFGDGQKEKANRDRSEKII